MMIKIRHILILWLFPALLAGQFNYNASISQIGSDYKDFFSAPKKWDKEDIFKISGIGLSTILLMQIDGTLRDFSLENNSYTKSIIPEAGRIYGEPLFNLLLGLGFYAYGASQNNELNKKTGFEILESGLITSSFIGVMKYSFGRARPSTVNSDPYTYKPFSFRGNEYVSLASGHTALAFSTSTVIFENSKSGLVKGLIYIPAIITGLSRIYQNHHWLSDVFLGAAIGYFTGKHLTKLHSKKVEPDKYREVFKISFLF